MNKAPFADCDACPLKHAQFVAPDELKDAPYTIVGESPGSTEAALAKRGTPNASFTGQSGKLLWAVLGNSGVSREQCNVTNAVLCQPSGEDKEEELSAAAVCCKPRLLAELQTYSEGQKILALGKTARESLLGAQLKGENFDTLHGRWGWVDGNPVLPTLHPAYVLRQPEEAKTMFDEIRKFVHTTHRNTQKPTYTVVTEETLEFVLGAMIAEGKPISFDIETEQVDYRYDKILLLVIANDPYRAYIIPGKHRQVNDVLYKTARYDIWKKFWKADVEFVGHNSKFDRRFLTWQLGWPTRCEFDTMLAHYTLDERKGTHDLKQLAARHLDVADYEISLVNYLRSKNDNYGKIDWGVLCQYAAWDAVCTLLLRDILDAEMVAEGTKEVLFSQALMPLSDVTHKAEMRGIQVDTEYLTGLTEVFSKQMDEIEKEVFALGEGVIDNMNSSAQMAVLLYDKLCLPQVKSRKIKPRSTAKEVLEALKDAHPILSKIRTWRRINKMQTSYIDNVLEVLDENDCVHPDFKLHGTETGRLSVVNPAAQTIPRADEREAGQFGKLIKDAYVARPGYKLVVRDYSQAELRVAAALSGETYLIEAYRNGRDIHTEVAIGMYGPDYTKTQRVLCKMFNFSYLYGGNEFSFAEGAGLPVEVAKDFVHRYDGLMPKLKAFKQQCWDTMRRFGFVVGRTGRKRRIPFIGAVNAEDARKASLNAIDQGPASDMTSLSAIEADKVFGAHPEWDAHVLLLVHDSIVVECLNGKELEVSHALGDIMESVASKWFPEVPWLTEGEVGDKWGSVKAIH